MYRVMVADRQIDLASDNIIVFDFTTIDEAIQFAEQMLKYGKAVEVFRE